MKARYFSVFLFCCVCLSFTTVLATSLLNINSPIGTNLPTLAPWSSEYVFRNPVVQSGDWLTQSWLYWNTSEQHLIDFDENGWPRSFPADAQFEWLGTPMFMQIDHHYPAGEYIVTYEGEGEVAYGYDAFKNEEQSIHGRDVVTVHPGETPLGFLLKIMETDPNGTGNYIRNVQIEMPNVDVSQQFHPDFLDNIRSYKVIRLTDWQRTNWNAGGSSRHANEVEVTPRNVLDDATENPFYNPRPTERGGMQLLEWSERALPTDVRYTTEKGAPVEVMLDLVNELVADPWFNMPHHASADYVTQFATLTEQTLGAQQRVYVEYSNEIWNSGFYQSEWIEAQGEAQWPESNQSGFIKKLNYYGMKSAEICNIWKTVFAANPERVICVMAAPAANQWAGEQILDCPLWENAPCHAAIDAVAIAPYFGQHIGHPENDAAVQSWLDEPDGGLTKLFKELEFGGVLPASSIEPETLQSAMRRMTEYHALADRHGLTLVAYEGGQHLIGIGAVQFDDAINALFAEANRDARMGELYETYLAHWHDIGGEIFINYNSVGRYSRWGNWGAQEYNAQDSAVKRIAIENYIADTPCDWAACDPASSNIPTAVTVAQSSAQSMNATLLAAILTAFLIIVTLTYFPSRKR